jgi:hypothetical protein
MSTISINLNSLNPKSYKKTVRHKVQDGVNVFRMLPPFGQNCDGYPYHKWNVVWGLIDPSSGRARPFASSSTYEGRCPVYDYLDLLKEKVALLTDDAKIEELNKFISNLRPKTVYTYNAANKSGEVGVLELKSTAHKKVLSIMERYIKEYNQDPTSLNFQPSDSGVWFQITKTGKGFDTSYDAAKNQSMVKDANGVPSYQDDRTALVENIIHNYDSLGYDLTTLYQKLSYDELKDILVANIVSLSKHMPELLVAGFGLGDLNSEVTLDDAAANNATVSLQINSGTSSSQAKVTTSKTAPKPQGNGVSINLHSANDIKDDTDDILAMADDIFNS